MVRAGDPLQLLTHIRGVDRDFKPELSRLFGACKAEVPVDPSLRKMVDGRLRYERLAPSIPWQVIAAIHMMESDGDFRAHLHNGDPLTARTVHAPAGRPAAGSPPFSWEQSALDVLRSKGWLRSGADWSLGATLERVERYNGLGYRRSGLPPSPYLWAGSNHERCGKFIDDGKFDPTAVSQQIGVAVLLRAMVDRGLFVFPSEGGAL
ncbi:hypothetical protein CCP2SC5_1860003 [Azospirillaceae bacterium]